MAALKTLEDPNGMRNRRLMGRSDLQTMAWREDETCCAYRLPASSQGKVQDLLFHVPQVQLYHLAESLADDLLCDPDSRSTLVCSGRAL